MARKVSTKNVYDDNSIEVKKFPDNVQSRPTMYIGSVGVTGNTHLAKEVIDNSVDEAMNGYGSTITISISNKGGYCSVKDEGRGIPIKSIEKCFTILHSSGKFNNDDYSVSAGTNGVGTTAVNGLSKLFVVYSSRDGYTYTQEFKNGIKQCEPKKVKKCSTTGTTIIFYPNEDFMETSEFSIETIIEECEMKSYINKGIKFIINDDDKKKKYQFYHKDGIKEYVSEMCKDPIIQPILFETQSEVSKKIGKNTKKFKIGVEVSLSYSSKGSQPIIKSFCNSLYTSDGGTHVTGFKLGMNNTIKKYIEENNMLTKKDKSSGLEINGDSIIEGIVAVVSVKHSSAQYDSQTKNKLANSEVQGAVQKAVNDEFGKWMQEHSKEAKDICKKVILSAKAALAAKKAKELVNKKNDAFSSISDLSKLASCNSNNPEECELFIVEGNSAGGTAKDCRDKQFQAIYALRGKPLNANNLDAVKIFSNKEYSDLVYILTGLRNAIDSEFDINTLKYHKIIIMSDADVDGLHIQALLISFFFKHMREVIEQGHLYVAMPPLYSVLENKKRVYLLNDTDYSDYISKIICKKYKFFASGKERNTASAISKIMNVLNKFKFKLTELLEADGIDKQFIETAFAYKFQNQDCKDSEVGKFLKGLGELKATKNEDKTDVIFFGIFEGSYINIEFKEVMKYVSELVEYANKIKLPKDLDIVSIDAEFNQDLLLPSVKYDEVVTKCTPKSRVRLKGLGEMDSEELWNTTMSPTERNLIQVTIDDEDKAFSVMEDMLNSNSKYSDRRKVFLLKNQEKAEALN